MRKMVLSFAEIRKDDILLAGGKGANLGEMVSAGIPVPPGTVLTAQAYDRYIEENGIPVEEILKTKDTEAEISEALQKRIMAGAFPEDIEQEIRSFYRTLRPDARIAVRSSATAEDLADASFAGQQETFLNVIGEEMVLDKIRECYASLWGVRAIHYRAVSGHDREKVSLAVVLQQMINSDTAGVIFTKDPSGGDGVLINASYGLGEAVVSGIVSPDEYICGRDGVIRHQVTGSKEIMIVYGDQGTVRKAVSEEKRSQPALRPERISDLVRTALQIEAHYGQPMDIEWAIEKGRIYILQARNITTLQESERRFTEADFENLPKVRPARGRMRENVLFNLEKLPRPYYPLDHDFGDCVGKQKEVLIAEIGIKMNEMTPIDGDGISSFSLGGFRLTRRITSIPGMIRQMKDDEFNVRKSAQELVRCTEAYEEELSTECTDIKSAGRSLEALRTLIAGTAYARFRYAIFPQVLENMGLNRILKKVDSSLNSFDLMDGLSYVTADINREMAEIAERIRRNPEMMDAVMTRSYREITEQYEELREILGRFMQKYGHRSDFNCYCFTAKSWNEDPDRFLHTMRTMLRSGNAGVISTDEGMARFDALMARVRGTVNEKRYMQFERKTAAVRHYHMIREATQYLCESIFELCRQRLRTVAACLGESCEDLLYLFADELFEVCRAGILDDRMRTLIEHRKEMRPLAENYWNYSISTLLDSGTDQIEGVCGSSGKAAGKACIIHGPEEFGRLQKGDILVCPYTDPEWTPLFTLAAGVVVDTGGSLSHAAIVAREYRIPAVLATGGATGKIRDGSMIMVDGNTGKVTIL